MSASDGTQHPTGGDTPPTHVDSSEWRELYSLNPEALQAYRKGLATRVLWIALAAFLAGVYFAAWEQSAAKALCFAALAAFLALGVFTVRRRGGGTPTPRNIALAENALRIDARHLPFADIKAIRVDITHSVIANSLHDALLIVTRDGKEQRYDLGYHATMDAVFPRYREFRLALRAAYRAATGNEVED